LTEIPAAAARRIRNARAMIFDMDGTLVLGDAASAGHQALPGAIDLLQRLRSRGIPFRVFTNGTAKTPAVYAAGLRHAGFEIDDAEMMTPSTSAAEWFVRRGFRRVRVLGLEGVQAPLRELGLDVIGPFETARGIEAVFTGWFREFTFASLETACEDIWAGASLTTASHVPFFATQNGRAIGTSFAINAMIRALTGKRARVLGKPAKEVIDCAMRQMGLSPSDAVHTIVVGDDPTLEMRMANAAQAFGVAVTTGLTKAATFRSAPKAEKPRVVISSLNPLLKAIS
jgi:HAD superfamily hydrolase (TIGR01450 family)